jgi:hypothetical protein
LSQNPDARRLPLSACEEECRYVGLNEPTIPRLIATTNQELHADLAADERPARSHIPRTRSASSSSLRTPIHARSFSTLNPSFTTENGHFARNLLLFGQPESTLVMSIMYIKTLISVLLLASTASGADPQQMPAQIQPAVRALLTALLPNPRPAGAAAQAPATFYSSSTLYEYIDGAADVFQGYDVEAVLHQEFKAGLAELTVDIFDMGSIENAFGMYASERSPKYDFVEVGVEGYRNEGILNFFQDRYYVKIAGFGSGADAAIAHFAADISRNIGGEKNFPALLSKLPEAGRKPHSELYLRKDPLGHPFLSPAYQAVYAFAGGESTLMISLGASAADAATKLKSLEDHFRKTGQWTPAAEYGRGAARGSNSFEGSLVAATTGSNVLILLNPVANSAAFFREALTRFQ